MGGVSRNIRAMLVARAMEFNIVLEDVAITHLTFGKEYTAAVEAKQVAQQDAERARFVVEKAMQDKKSTIIRAQGEAKSAKLIAVSLDGCRRLPRGLLGERHRIAHPGVSCVRTES